MYIRIQDNSIRYRLSKQEAGQLAEGKALHSSLTLSPSLSLNYAVETTLEKSRFEYDKYSNGLLLHLNNNDLSKELESRPSKKGFIFTQSFEDKTISISLEIDLKKNYRS